MKAITCCVIVLSCATLAFLQPLTWTPAVNNRPVIGLLAQQSNPDIKEYGEEYVMSEYVKFLEMAGASVVIVKGDQPVEYYVEIFKRVNGVLFPGGRADLIISPYARTCQILFALALDANDRGDYFPIWATCRGFEMLSALVTKRDLLNSTDSEDLHLPLKLAPSYNESRLLGNAPKEVLHYLTNENITANFHKMCLSTKTFMKYESLHKFYRLISFNQGRQGVEFVSTMEAYNYPIYGVQWHPEKSVFTRRVDQRTLHTAHAVRVSQYMANFFVTEARKSRHRFASDEELARAVIENDHRVFMKNKYIEDYFFNITKMNIH